MVKFDKVTIRYDEKTVISDLSFTVAKGEQLILAGESGKGKTTILNTIMGFVLPSKGEVYVDGLLLNDNNIKQIRTKISWLPQQVNIYANTVEELFFSVFNLKENKKFYPDKKKTEETFASLNLSVELLNRRIDEISGGQKQRIILASLLILDKPVFLLDEPTSALDSENSKNIFDLLKEKNKTVIAATHDRYWIENSDKIIEL